MCIIVYIDQADSTNTLMAASAAEYKHGMALAARDQTLGRGQRGNTWESEPGKNLTFSVMLRPSIIIASHQFELSQLVTLSLVEAFREEMGTDEVYVKWPNDIYYRDQKLCGILIENSLSGNQIDHSIVGIGLNVNQEKFLSDAPNPISMRNVTGKEYNLEVLLEKLVNRIVDDFDEYENKPNPTRLTGRYRQVLWRGEGFWPYRDNLTGEFFNARIAAIAPTGHLTLTTQGGRFKTFAFKEVSPILK